MERTSLPALPLQCPLMDEPVSCPTFVFDRVGLWPGKIPKRKKPQEWGLFHDLGSASERKSLSR
jgi:hypothetical protein